MALCACARLGNATTHAMTANANLHLLENIRASFGVNFAAETNQLSG
jgi:hypothetical protein